MTEKKHVSLKCVLVRCVLPALLSGVLHALSFPNELWGPGLNFLAFIALVPVLYSVFTNNRRQAALSGFVYGASAYALFSTFYAGTSATGLYFTLVFGHGLGYAALFYVFRCLDERMPVAGPFAMAFLHTAYGFLFVSKWWLAVSYGFLPYALYRHPVFTQICDLVGVLGLLFIMTLTQISIARLIRNRTWKTLKEPAVIASGLIVVFQIVYGMVALKTWAETMPDRTIKLGVIQPACGDFNKEYGTLEGWNLLKGQILEISKEEPELIVSSETSFTYPIGWFDKYPVNRYGRPPKLDFFSFNDILSRQSAASELLSIQKETGVPILLGNVDITMNGECDPYPDGWESEYLQLNNAILIENGEISSSYTKNHLAPMWETYPLTGIKAVREFYKSKEIKLYAAGKQTNSILFDGLRIGTPICFEGHFPYICSGFKCDLFVSIGSNSYDQDGIGQLNDAIISSFRAIENRRTYVRVFNTGLSCMFDPTGKMIEKLPQHKRMTAVWNVDIYNRCTTLYSHCPDLLGWFSVAISLAAVIFLTVVRKKKKKEK